MPIRNREIVFSALFISLGVIIPIVFHKFGLGAVFLPMFLPILICGFFVNPKFAITTGFLTPYISSIITGMPPLFPFAFVMSFEGAALSGSASLLFNKLKKNLWISLFLALFFQRVVFVLLIIILAPFFQLPEKWLSITAITSGIPGIILQIAIVPLFVKKFKTYLT
ncbi:ECF transporter S component [candidate division KSB1 bacterium]|nr:MAG: ECF transporter S component [candidate division KSB1 bacterium]